MMPVHPSRSPIRSGREAGTSLAELLVAMVIFGIVSAIVVASIVRIQTSAEKNRGAAAAAQEAQRGFLRLDKQVRAASALNRPVAVGNDWYVEMLTTATGTPVCTQWRLRPAAKRLESRTWTVSGAAAQDVTVWVPAATGVTHETMAGPPFWLLPANNYFGRQMLRVNLSFVGGAGRLTGTAHTKTTLVARNTSVETVTNPDANGDDVSDVEICREIGRS